MARGRATIDDLYRIDGQAELIGGRIVRHPPHGFKVGILCGNLVASLRAHEERTRNGYVSSSTVGYVVPALPSGRESFCADVSYYTGPLPAHRMKFVEGAPTFAVEVRDEGSGEEERVAKRADYFAAGTVVVWDVDPIAETITCNRRAAPAQGVVWRRGDTADAEPAVPGWRIAVEEVFGVS
jgi:Uma2 family endonuclease